MGVFRAWAEQGEESRLVAQAAGRCGEPCVVRGPGAARAMGVLSGEPGVVGPVQGVGCLLRPFREEARTGLQ